MNTISLSPPNAILFVLDSSSAAIEVPTYVEGELVASTSTCVSVGTQADVDGETEVALGSPQDEAPDGLQMVFEGEIDTPGHVIAVSTAELDVVLQMQVEGLKAQVTIWADDLWNPSKILVLAS